MTEAIVEGMRKHDELYDHDLYVQRNLPSLAYIVLLPEHPM